jgi:predicted oxidoreductase (fatty acid repression mutant protein)
MNNNDTETAEYWKKKALESQQRIYISINTAMPLNYEDIQQQIKEAIEATPTTDGHTVKTYTTIYNTYHKEPTAEEIMHHIKQISQNW